MDKLVFLIDDDPIYLKTMQNHFRLLGGFQTEAYTNGDEALVNISKDPFLIILDHHLQDPNKNGIYFLKEIRKKKPKTPVLYMTSDNNPEIVEKVNASGGNKLIVKDSAFLVYLRTALDEILQKNEKKSFFKRLFN